MEFSWKSSSSLNLLLISLFVFFSANSCQTHEDFLQCLSNRSSDPDSIAKLVYTQDNSSFSSVLNVSINNLRFTTPTTPRPLVIVTPLHVSHIQASIICARASSMEVRVRSGGHDYEGLSYVSDLPFVIVDLMNLRQIIVDVANRTAWVQSGATVGELYYNIGKKSDTLGFPAGVCPSVGIGGHFSGGGYGVMLRKYALAADNVIDAQMIDVNGTILDKESMGEDMFWAIRGGGGASFGVIISWTIKLVEVPEIVTVFSVARNLESNLTKLVRRWQSIAPKSDENLFIRLIFDSRTSSVTGNRTVTATFNSLYLGRREKLIPLLKTTFPELGLTAEDCVEMSWIQSTIYFAGYPYDGPSEVLLIRTQPSVRYFKAKSDYVTEPVPESGLKGIWERLMKEDDGAGMLIFTPYGGIMNRIPESKLPFPHRAGNLYKIQHLVLWDEDDEQISERHFRWIRELYSYMGRYASRNPRSAYINYRDLDIGMNNREGMTSYRQAKKWGEKYFKGNFKRLVKVKTMADPANFFKQEQTIPSASIFLVDEGLRSQLADSV